ncbi:MAG: 2-phosphosulfolactate phosphatase [Candidatus Hydrogenedentes bacterium]|nr:2-phosphosulfolactate phosphatase [Candidatus Hydrogenedentota bacterium]
MQCHIIPGVKGCEFGKKNGLGIVIVDSLRASATSAMLLNAGALEILCVKNVETAFHLKNIYPDILLYGERNGLPPEGFDFGNSPQHASKAKGKRVVFTTTTGVSLLFDAYPTEFVIMGSTINLRSLCNFVKKTKVDVVVVPAGLYDDDTFPAEEDWATSTLIAKTLGYEIGRGASEFKHWEKKIESEGIQKIFETSTHARKLIKLNLFSDVLFCAQLNLTTSIPIVTKKEDDYLILKDVYRRQV